MHERMIGNGEYPLEAGHLVVAVFDRETAWDAPASIEVGARSRYSITARGSGR